MAARDDAGWPARRPCVTYAPTALTFDGLAGQPEPGEMILAANYATADPEVERKRKKGYRQMLKREQAEAAAGGR